MPLIEWFASLRREQATAMRPVLSSIAIERTQPSLVRERIPESAFAQNGKSLHQTLERTLCWQAPASSLDIFFNQLEDPWS